MSSKTEITDRLLRSRNSGKGSVDALVPHLYEDLKRIARSSLRAERMGHTLDTTALVHEAYLRLVDDTRVEWRDRAHFLGAAAVTIRRVLVDHARRHRALKRGGDRRRIALDPARLPVEESADALVELDEALGQLEALDERLSRVVECRFFGGLTVDETAAALGVTARTVRRDWAKAKGLLHMTLSVG